MKDKPDAVFRLFLIKDDVAESDAGMTDGAVFGGSNPVVGTRQENGSLAGLKKWPHTPSVGGEKNLSPGGQRLFENQEKFVRPSPKRSRRGVLPGEAVREEFFFGHFPSPLLDEEPVFSKPGQKGGKVAFRQGWGDVITGRDLLG